ncbi:ArsR family transcriptional regulator [Salinadaptatus halalkaliphilus]|uniref:ArsR family transcriptional regulator n=1 Tax=Salinadaptatus halalkaliphilus TaxID=2419781 RepID=A0A4S3TQB0_9EURY|nr:helix-turn-helix transcriptional regulator [Salinadaptatus halalkaliphilus]THE65405.1 ArsR family transcriptional regulator [Salinadaptatus halalkaliphilus]
MDELFEALSSAHRRRILRALLDHRPHDDGGLRVPADVFSTAQSTDSLELALYHTHLPRLADLGLVQWNRETRMVRPGPRFEDITGMLEHCDEYPRAAPQMSESNGSVGG